ncbi:MAG: hypothetical protein R3F31_20545 [Verrucomicrobiales bacterium]
MGGKLTNEDLALKLLELPLDRPTTLDMLWGFFFATGSESPIRRLVEAFRFEDVSEPPPGAKIPQGYVPLFTQLPEMAAWSITSMAAEHPKVAEFCVHFYESPKESQLRETESRWLRNKVLPTIDPKKFPAPTESESPKVEPVEKPGRQFPQAGHGTCRALSEITASRPGGAGSRTAFSGHLSGNSYHQRSPRIWLLRWLRWHHARLSPC